MKSITAIASALSDESRVRILAYLGGGELCLCQVIQMLGLAPSTVSKHMAILAAAGLVEMRKEGRWRYYRLAGRGASAPARGALRWLAEGLRDDPGIQGESRRVEGVRAQEVEKVSRCCYGR